MTAVHPTGQCGRMDWWTGQRRTSLEEENHAPDTQTGWMILFQNLSMLLNTKTVDERQKHITMHKMLCGSLQALLEI